jgi:hypothetical protein
MIRHIKGLLPSGLDLLREGETARVLPICDPVTFVERLAWCDNCAVAAMPNRSRVILPKPAAVNDRGRVHRKKRHEYVCPF